MTNFPACSTDQSFFATPRFLTISLHCLSLIELPIHVFGAYCILFKTPPKMSSVKWSLLSMHSWQAATDLTTSFLTIPYLVLPAMGGFPLGVLGELGVPTDVLVYLNMSLVACAGCSIIGLFESRYTSLVGGPLWKKYGRYAFELANFTMAFTFMIPQFVWFVPDQRQALQAASKLFLCGADPPTTTFFIGGGTWYLIPVIFFLAVYGFVCMLVFSNKILKHLGRLAATSKHTYQLQKKLQYAMVVQTVIPTGVFIIPVLLIIGSVFTNFHSQGLNNVAVLILCTHGLSSTIALLLIHQPYRSALLSSIPLPNRHTQTMQSAKPKTLIW